MKPQAFGLNEVKAAAAALSHRSFGRGALVIGTLGLERFLLTFW